MQSIAPHPAGVGHGQSSQSLAAAARESAPQAPPALREQVRQRLLGLMLDQFKAGVIPTLSVVVMTLMIAPLMANALIIAGLAVLRALSLWHNLFYANKLRGELAAGQPNPRTEQQLILGSAASAFVWGLLTWPLQIGANLDFLAFLIVTISLFSVCLSVITAGYHRPTLLAVSAGGLLGLAPKIAELTPTIGFLLPIGFAIYGVTIVGYALSLNRQARAGILLQLRRRAVSRRLARTNAALESTLDQARWLADRDPLTELRNRRAFERELAVFMARYAHRNSVLLLLDIDHFKSINDRFGHATGDGVLLAIGTSLRQWEDKASGRMVARWGGEEFIAVVALRPDEHLSRHAEDLRNRIEALGEELCWPAQVSISTSIGCAYMPAIEGLDDALRGADAALYKAKDAGRNCWKLAA